MMKPVPERATQGQSSQGHAIHGQPNTHHPKSNKASSSTSGGKTTAGKIAESTIQETNTLDYQGTYICPICRHGHISALTLMDAFACNFCRHIFTANLTAQSVQVVDSSQPMSWRWNGRTWRAMYQDDPSLTMVIWIVGIVLVTLPAFIVWGMAYLFPPLPGSRWAWFPNVWLGCTLGIHLLMVAWLLAEHYQLPLYIANRIRLRAWLGRR